MHRLILEQLRRLRSQHTWTCLPFQLTLIFLGYHQALSRISGLSRKSHNYVDSLDSEIFVKFYHLQNMVQNCCSNRYALDDLAEIRCTSWGCQERTRNFWCHVACHPMTSNRWSSNHHRDAHCPLKQSPLSGPCYHKDGGSQLYPNRHGMLDIEECMWSQVQSFPWWILLGI